MHHVSAALVFSLLPRLSVHKGDLGHCQNYHSHFWLLSSTSKHITVTPRSHKPPWDQAVGPRALQPLLPQAAHHHSTVTWPGPTAAAAQASHVCGTNISYLCTEPILVSFTQNHRGALETTGATAQPVQGDPRPSSSLLRWTFSAFLLEQCLYSSPTMSCQSPLGHSHEKTTATSVGGKAAHGAQHPPQTPQWRGRETPSFPHSLPCAETLESQLPWHVTEPLPLRERRRRVTLIISEADV